jgi:CHASE2 domain-containing sensor protein
VTSRHSAKRIAGTSLILVIGIAPSFEALAIFFRYQGPMSALAASLKSSEESHVAVVTIDRADFVHSFDFTTPLRCKPLEELIAAVAEAGASRIGIDLDTSDDSYRDLAAIGASNLFWAQTAQYSQTQRAFFVGRPALGGSGSPQTGLTALATDGDGVVRWYQRTYPKVADTEPVPGSSIMSIQRLRSFVAVLADSQNESDIGTYQIDFRQWNRQSLLASYVRKAALEVLRVRLGGKIVLVGSGYDGRDEHQTPLGWRSGVEILADAIDTEVMAREGRNYRAPSRARMILWSFLIACLTLSVFRFSNPWHRRLPIAVTLLGAVLFLAGYFAYGSPANFVFFLPTVASVSIALLLEKFKERSDRELASPDVVDQASKPSGV